MKDDTTSHMIVKSYVLAGLGWVRAAYPDAAKVRFRLVEACGSRVHLATYDRTLRIGLILRWITPHIRRRVTAYSRALIVEALNGTGEPLGTRTFTYTDIQTRAGR